MKIFTNKKLAKSMGKAKLMKGETKVKILRGGIITAFLAMSLGGLLTGCGTQDTKAPEETPTAGQVQVQPADEDENARADKKIDFVWLADLLKLENLDIDSTLNTQEIADQVTEDVGVAPGVAVDEYGNPINPEDLTEEVTIDGNYFIAPDGSVWETEQDYLDYINGLATGDEEVIIDENDGYYHAPDGSIWESEAEYLAYIEGLNGGEDEVIIVDDGGSYDDGQSYYIAPDGSYWDSEEAYLAFINQNQNSEEYTDETGTADENDGYYHAPDGSIWASEAEYQNYINSLTGTSETYTEEDQEVITSDFSGYQAPDGSYWESEAEYLEYINGANEDVQTYEAEEAPVVEDSSYYVAPDGSTWASESDYNEFVNSMSSTATEEAPAVGTGTTETAEETYEDVEVIVAEPDYAAAQAELEAQDAELNKAETPAAPAVEETVTSEPVVEQPVVEQPAAEENEYYTAPDGSVWASKADYDLYMAAEAENAIQR